MTRQIIFKVETLIGFEKGQHFRKQLYSAHVSSRTILSRGISNCTEDLRKRRMKPGKEPHVAREPRLWSRSPSNFGWTEPEPKMF